MARPQKLDPSLVDSWLGEHPQWMREGEALVRTYRFHDFAAPLSFAVRIGMVAEKRDHHPDLHIGWGRAKVAWTTHDAGGITQLDLDLAMATDRFAEFALS